ncbi:Rossmann-fold NAD(P)-binding domain-containing protein [Roseomonas populi]|uniref:SDR family NAD(P)-dependent oxidoreductase n=1 Tax=Roseomonas populi TaxID=3121582 RepID=A0ABT1WY00_9PROT|nr:SDR family NAD(P)-dependent oxidoreductase [Roseomonas pecuniae]MCR0980715.1 SDR family NAD(P)-dependent oxidoreductase [Roseomonas pecuniae]
MDRHLLVIGLGFSGTAIARHAAEAGWRVTATARNPARAAPPPGVDLLPFAEAGPALAGATHLAVTAPPAESAGQGPDPVLAAHAAALAAAPLRWIGYLSTTGVYGDRGGAWVDETTEPAPAQPRSIRRRAAELQWEAFATRAAVDLLRCAGIYGPGRSVLDDLRAGTARRTVRPGHAFGRIHCDDIARAVLAAASNPPPPGLRVLHLADDEPAESAAVTEGAARMLGLPPPAAIPFETARAAMSPMALSFWAENRRISSARTKAALGIAWRYPSWREGLAAILAEERAEEGPKEGPKEGRDSPR